MNSTDGMVPSRRAAVQQAIWSLQPSSLHRVVVTDSGTIPKLAGK